MNWIVFVIVSRRYLVFLKQRQRYSQEIPIAVVESDGDRCRVIENAEKRHDFESAGNESSEVRSE